MVETRSKTRTAATTTKMTSSKARAVPTATPPSKDICGDMYHVWSKCRAPTDVVKRPVVRSGSAMYNAFVQTLIKTSCKPYNGKKVFIVYQNGKYEFICPDYKIRIGHYDLSVSVATNGYIYIHFLQDFFPHSETCVYSGDHLTIGPTGKTHIHFHITNILYQLDAGHMMHVQSQNIMHCSLPLADIVDVFTSRSYTAEYKKQWLKDSACVAEDLKKMNKNTIQAVQYDHYLFDTVFRLFLRGFPATS